MTSASTGWRTNHTLSNVSPAVATIAISANTRMDPTTAYARTLCERVSGARGPVTATTGSARFATGPEIPPGTGLGGSGGPTGTAGRAEGSGGRTPAARSTGAVGARAAGMAKKEVVEPGGSAGCGACAGRISRGAPSDAASFTTLGVGAIVGGSVLGRGRVPIPGLGGTAPGLFPVGRSAKWNLHSAQDSGLPDATHPCGLRGQGNHMFSIAFLILSLFACGTTPSERAAADAELEEADERPARKAKASKKSGQGAKSAHGARGSGASAPSGRGGSARAAASGPAKARGGSAAAQGPTQLGALGDVTGTLVLTKAGEGDALTTSASIQLVSTAGTQSAPLAEVPGTCAESDLQGAPDTTLKTLWTFTCTSHAGTAGIVTVGQANAALLVRRAKAGPDGSNGPFKLAKRIPLVEGAVVVKL